MISEAEPTNYDTYLGPLETEDLGEVYEKRFIVITQPAMKIHQLLENQPSDSIGIAGPRGSGKTTLLHSIPPVSLPKENGTHQKRLSVVASAPVAYEAREFILHLFLLLCEKVLEANDEGLPVASWSQIASTIQRQTALIWRPIGWLLAILGTAFVAVGLIIAAGSLRALADQVATILMLGLTLSVLGYGLVFWQIIAWIRERKRRRTKPTGPPDWPSPRYEVDYLVDTAKWWLKTIRFQQSYSVGWGGSLKLPVGVEANVSGAVSLADKQLSLPQIVEGFTKFVNQASKRYQVVIGIDELDKMESDNKAQEFLNQIKGIFPSKAFYLVSVSEGAMSQFEQRGRPFRDVFDSSFGDMVYVDYLNFKEARQIIVGRVKGQRKMPIAFEALCHCLSGGLARDLMRACRDLVMLRSKDPDRDDILTLATRCIESELEAKLRSMSFRVKQMKVKTGKDPFISKLRELRSMDLSVKSLLDTTEKLFQEASKAPQGMRPAYLVLTVYLYYYVTLLQTFSRKTSSRTWKEEGLDKVSEWADSLAVARQSLTESGEDAKSQLDDYRKKYRMRRLAFPA